MTIRLGAIVLVVLALAGCGGGGDGSAKVASKADFIKAADRICVQRDTRGRTSAREPGTNVGRLSRELAQAYEDAIAQVQALDLPSGAARAGAREYVDSVVAMGRPVARMKAAAADVEKAGDVPALKAASAELQINVNTVQAVGDVADKNAREYGMRSCGQQQSLPVT